MFAKTPASCAQERAWEGFTEPRPRETRNGGSLCHGFGIDCLMSRPADRVVIEVGPSAERITDLAVRLRVGYVLRVAPSACVAQSEAALDQREPGRLFRQPVTGAARKNVVKT